MAKGVGGGGRAGGRGGELPKSTYTGSGYSRMDSLTLPSGEIITSGKSGRWTNTLRNYGGVIVHTTKSGANIWAKIYSQKGYLLRSFTGAPISGKIGALNRAAAEIAKLTDFTKLTSKNVTEPQGESTG